MTPDELVVDATGDVGEREGSLLSRERRVEAHLEQEVAQLLFEVLVALAGLRIEMLDRLQHLVGLFEQMPRQRVVRLLTIPWAPFAEHVDELVEAGHL